MTQWEFPQTGFLTFSVWWDEIWLVGSALVTWRPNENEKPLRNYIPDKSVCICNISSLCLGKGLILRRGRISPHHRRAEVVCGPDQILIKDDVGWLVVCSQCTKINLYSKNGVFFTAGCFHSDWKHWCPISCPDLLFNISVSTLFSFLNLTI